MIRYSLVEATHAVSLPAFSNSPSFDRVFDGQVKNDTLAAQFAPKSEAVYIQRGSLSNSSSLKKKDVSALSMSAEPFMEIEAEMPTRQQNFQHLSSLPTTCDEAANINYITFLQTRSIALPSKITSKNR